MISLKSILVPTDFSKQSQSAIRYGVEFALKFGAKLHVLHAVQDVANFLPELGFINPAAALSNIEPMLQSASKSMEEFLKPYKNQGVEFVTHCLQGNPLDEIILLAKEENIDLIILGTHGHTGLAHLFLGSLAETLVRQSPCPVLSLRSPEHEFVES